MSLPANEVLFAILAHDCPKERRGAFEYHILELHCTYAFIINAKPCKILYVEFADERQYQATQLRMWNMFLVVTGS